jgi:hypothetical protein
MMPVNKATCDACKIKGEVCEPYKPAEHRYLPVVQRPYVAVLDGVGTTLTKLFEQFGISKEESIPKGCGGTCDQWIQLMNSWGPEGCRQRRKMIVKRLDEMKSAMTWKAKLKAVAAALTSSFKPNPLDISGSFLDEAIRIQTVRDNSSPQA